MQEFDLQVINPGDNRWLSFLQQRVEANIFHHPAWLDLLKECYGYRPFVLALNDANGSIHAGLPFMEVKHPFRGRRWISLPFSDHCIPLASEAEAVIRLNDLIQSLAKKPKSPPIEMRWNMLDSATKQTPTSYVLHMLLMDPDFEKVKSQIHHSHRRNVRIAQDHGIQIRHGTERRDLEAFYDLHLETRHRQGVPVQPTNYFRLLDDMLLKKGLGFISLAYHGSEYLAGAVFLHWNRTLTYKYGASLESGLLFRPNHLIFWEAIQWGCEHGYSLLDFGRSECYNDGLRHFKSRWGAREFPLCYFNLPVKTRSSYQERFLMSAIPHLIRKTPLWVCKLGGEIYYRIVA
jgi:CelD/BcsL family acetyltransferase involved in cellulose biosynthesis